jgi:DNA-binding SARP family transcriptional activator
MVFIASQPTADLILSAFRAGAQDIVTNSVDMAELLDLTERTAITTARSIASHPDSPGRRFNLKNLWTQILSGNQGCVKFGLSNEHPSYSSRKGKEPDDSSAVGLTDTNAVSCSFALEGDHFTRKLGDGARMRIFFLGHFQTMIGNRVVDDWPSKKGKSIFAYLSYHSSKQIHRDVLMDVFWPKSMHDSARNCLNVAIHGLRKLFQRFDPEEEYIVFGNECYSINPEIEVWTDVNEFVDLWVKAQSVERSQGLGAAAIYYNQIASMYRDDFMFDELYEDWSTLERENLKEIFLVTLEKISENHYQLGNLAETITICKVILDKDNCREEIYCRLMKCYNGTGHRDKALRVYSQCAQCIRTELDAEPTSTTTELFKKIKAGHP